MPTVPFGIATHHVEFSGTIDIGFDGLYAVIKGIVDGLSRHGVKKFVFLNGHGGNTPALDKVALEANKKVVFVLKLIGGHLLQCSILNGKVVMVMDKKFP